MSFGNKRREKDPIINADKAADLAVAYWYHITVNLWIEGNKQARKLLNLLGLHLAQMFP